MKWPNFPQLLLLLLSLTSLFACKSEEEVEPYDPTTQGRVSFELVRHNVYILSDLTDARTIKVTLLTSEGDTLALPSLPLSGNEDLISTPFLPLPAGEYTLLGYRCFDLQADLIEDLDIELTKDNRFEVAPGTDTPFSLPIQVKQVLTTSNLYNSLRGICLEILGDDESLWPASWDFESGEIDINWAGLEFDTDANSNPTDVIGLVIDGEPDYIINSDTWERQLVSLPEFHDMKVLPSCVANLTGLQNLVIRRCMLEEIPVEIAKSHINSLAIEHTPLKHLPEELGEMPDLTDVFLRGNALSQFPACFTRVSTMEVFSIEDEALSEIPASIAAWGEHLVSLTIAGTLVKEIPDVFDRLWHISSLDFSRNAHLSTLPPTIGMEKIPYGVGENFSYSAITGLDLHECAFTSIPAEVQRGGIRYLNMARNAITQVTAQQISAMTDLETLVLDGNQLTHFPRLTNPRLTMLSLIGTGLTREMVDLSGLPSLNPRYVFFTQEEYDAVFK